MGVTGRSWRKLALPVKSWVEEIRSWGTLRHGGGRGKVPPIGAFAFEHQYKGGHDSRGHLLGGVWHELGSQQTKTKRPASRAVSGEVLKHPWRGSEFEMGVLAANSINRKILIDVVPAMSPYNRFGFQLSRTC